MLAKLSEGRDILQYQVKYKFIVIFFSTLTSSLPLTCNSRKSEILEHLLQCLYSQESAPLCSVFIHKNLRLCNHRRVAFYSPLLFYAFGSLCKNRFAAQMNSLVKSTVISIRASTDSQWKIDWLRETTFELKTDSRRQKITHLKNREERLVSNQFAHDLLTCCENVTSTRKHSMKAKNAKRSTQSTK